MSVSEVSFRYVLLLLILGIGTISTEICDFRHGSLTQVKPGLIQRVKHLTGGDTTTYRHCFRVCVQLNAVQLA